MDEVDITTFDYPSTYSDDTVSMDTTTPHQKLIYVCFRLENKDSWQKRENDVAEQQPDDKTVERVMYENMAQTSRSKDDVIEVLEIYSNSLQKSIAVISHYCTLGTRVKRSWKGKGDFKKCDTGKSKN